MVIFWSHLVYKRKEKNTKIFLGFCVFIPWLCHTNVLLFVTFIFCLFLFSYFFLFYTLAYTANLICMLSTQTVAKIINNTHTHTLTHIRPALYLLSVHLLTLPSLWNFKRKSAKKKIKIMWLSVCGVLLKSSKIFTVKVGTTTRNYGLQEQPKKTFYSWEY